MKFGDIEHGDARFWATFMEFELNPRAQHLSTKLALFCDVLITLHFTDFTNSFCSTLHVRRVPGRCETTGCATNLNQQCPKELRAGEGAACKSACEAFGSPEYCCSGAYSNPSSCRPSHYSQIFKAACPKSYSYAYDDATSTFTCTGADYTITFCPGSPRYVQLSPLLGKICC